MPWRQSMLDEHWSTEYNQEDVSTCNDTEIKALYALDYAFLKDAAGLNIENCLGIKVLSHIKITKTIL